MITFENTEVTGIDTAVHAMRLIYHTSDRADSFMCDGTSCEETCPRYKQKSDGECDGVGTFVIGDANKWYALCHARGSQEESNFLNTIHVSVNITAPAYIVETLLRLRVGTLVIRRSRNVEEWDPFSLEDFKLDATNKKAYEDLWYFIHENLHWFNYFNDQYHKTKDDSWYEVLRASLPSGYYYEFTLDCSFADLRRLCDRSFEIPQISEWNGKNDSFYAWIESLPFSELIVS